MFQDLLNIGINLMEPYSFCGLLQGNPMKHASKVQIKAHMGDTVPLNSYKPSHQLDISFFLLVLGAGSKTIETTVYDINF